MTHMTYEQWLKYTKGTLDEQTRMHYENHLYSCDHCLELYLQALEATKDELPDLSAPSSFTDSLMAEISKTKKPESKAPKLRKRKSRQREAVVHYVLAAAMTLLLISTGVFSQLMSVIGEFERTSNQQSESIIGGILNQTGSITEKIESNLKEVDQQ